MIVLSKARLSVPGARCPVPGARCPVPLVDDDRPVARVRRHVGQGARELRDVALPNRRWAAARGVEVDWTLRTVWHLPPTNDVVLHTRRMNSGVKCALVLTGVASLILNTVGGASADPLPVSPQARAAGLVDVRTVVPDAVIDLRYAKSANFVGLQLYPADARCLVHQDLARGLSTAADVLRRNSEVLVFWDCYRPHEVQARMFAAVPNPNWVARPGDLARSHQTGRSVDVTIAGVDMGTDFDDFTPRSLAYATDGVTAVQQANRARLREAMQAGGLAVYPGEWWHFDGPGAKEPRPILDVPVN